MKISKQRLIRGLLVLRETFDNRASIERFRRPQIIFANVYENLGV
jgi:hypothetical protein